MKKSTKTIIFSLAICMICAFGAFCVYALKNITLNSGGQIRFVAPGVSATISNATLTGLTKESGSGTMSTFTTTSTMTFTGNGIMTNYSTETEMPWNSYKNDILKIYSKSYLQAKKKEIFLK